MTTRERAAAIAREIAIEVVRQLRGEDPDYEHVTRELESAIATESPAPVPMFLTCPKCNARHIDEGEFATKVHHTHSCQSCGLTWRPAVVPTVGVAFLPGFKNAESPDPERQARERLVTTARSVAKYHEERERHGGAGRDFHAIAHTFCLDVAALLDRPFEKEGT